MLNGSSFSKNLGHPGSTLGQFIEYLLVPKGQAASHMGVSRATLFRILAEEGRITVDIAMRLEQAFQIDAGYWLKRQADYDVAQARESQRYAEIAPMKDRDEARDALMQAERVTFSSVIRSNKTDRGLSMAIR
tara:strand:- start:852 stop:1250 length:399 start_codon:yes stop_codon:yes gene_type:complete